MLELSINRQFFINQFIEENIAQKEMHVDIISMSCSITTIQYDNTKQNKKSDRII